MALKCSLLVLSFELTACTNRTLTAVPAGSVIRRFPEALYVSPQRNPEAGT
jgi:hypothetical protein